MRIIQLFTTIMLLTLGASLMAQPPVNEPVGLAAYTLKMPGFDWITKSTRHFRLHYLPGSAAERDLDALASQNEAFIARHLAMLEVEQYDRVIDLFYFDSRDQIKEIVTRPFRALADAESMTVLAVRSDDDVGRDAHEIMHVVSFDLWGGWDRKLELAWLGEGLATHADEPCNGYEMSELAAHILLNTQDGVALESLVKEFRQHPEMIGYMLMASFVEFVIEKYGLVHLRSLWNEGYEGLEKVLGKNVVEIEKEWHEYISSTYPNPEVPDWPDLKEHGCK